MRHLGQAVLAAALAVGALAAAFAQPAAGDTGQDDVSLAIQLASHYQPVAGASTGPSFQLIFNVNPRVGLIQVVKLTVALPDGLRWGYDGPDPGEGCQGTAPAVCTKQLALDSAGTVGGAWGWDVLADRPGTYEVTATVETTLPDPDMSNNTATLQFQVTEPSSSGSGGGGTTTKTSVTASAAKVKPVRPKAGSTVVATVRVTSGGARVRPARITCAGKIGGKKVKGRRRSAAGSAACRFATPRGAKGKLLRGTVSFTARSKRITKRFAVRLR